MDEITREYRTRVRALSDSLASTQEQLSMLNDNRGDERRDAEKTRYVYFLGPPLPPAWLWNERYSDRIWAKTPNNTWKS